ncbi:FtsX-like permease family protein [Kitasatospora sp. NPDC054939]
MLGFVVRRLRGRLPLATAVVLTVLITTAVLTALVAFNRTVGEAGLRQALQGGGHARTTVVVNGEHGFDARDKDDRAVREFAARLFDGSPVRTESLARSRSYGLPPAAAQATAPASAGTGQAPGLRKDADLTVLASLDRNRVRLLAGDWPAAAPAAAPTAGSAALAALQTAVPQSTLARLGLTPEALPAEVRLDDRYGGAPLTVRITGVYRANDPADLYWTLDPAGGREIKVSDFTTYGPLLIDDGAFAAGLPQNGRSWLLDADLTGTGTAGADDLRRRTPALLAQLPATAGLHPRTELPALLAELRSGALVSRSTLLIGALQLAVLASAALLLVVHLMAARQEDENALLTARGASRLRLGGFTATEAALLTLPAALLAPLLTPPLLTALGSFGPLAGTALDTGLSPDLWLTAALCALACVALTTLPAFLRSAGAAVLRRAGRRQALAGNAVRSGVDVAVLALAVLAYQQLARYDGGLSTGADGELGLDPILIATPTLALCAGTLLVLRLLPLAAGLGGRLAARGRGLGPALVGWQLARRPGRASGPVLLLVLAVSTGVLALGQQHAWSTSQHDQADYATAGGLRIHGTQSAPMGQGGRYGALPGGDRMVPVVRKEQTLPNGTTAQLLALDAAAFADRVPVRPDLLDGQDRHALFTPLGRPGPTGPQAGIPLPGNPRRIEADVTVRLIEHTLSPWGDTPDAALRPDLWLILRDRFAHTYRVPLPGLPVNGDAKVSVDLAALTDAPLGSAATPLTVTGMVVAYGSADFGSTGGELTVHRLATADSATGPATTVPVPAGLGWQAAAPVLQQGSAPEARILTDPAADGTPALVKLRHLPADGAPRALRTVVTPAGAAPVPRDVPGVATRGYLDAVGARVGDVVRAGFGAATVPVRITGAVEALPVAGATALAVDLDTAARLLAADGQELPPTGEWWLPAAGPDDRAPAEAAAALRAAPGAPALSLREEVAADLLDDPLSGAPQSALAAIAVVTAVLAAIGFAAASAAAAGERARESAVLIALGTPRRRLRRTATAEQGVLVALGTAVGLGLGALMVHLIVPLVVLTPSARRPVPEVLVELPVGGALLLAAAIAAVPLLSAFLTGRRRRDVADRLRYLEEM